MYNIIQHFSELQIFPRTGYKKKQTHSKKRDLFTRYLTNKAIAGAAKVAADNLKEERKGKSKSITRHCKDRKKGKCGESVSQPIKQKYSQSKTETRLERTTQNCGSTPRTDHRSCNAGAGLKTLLPKDKKIGTPRKVRGRDCCTPDNGNPDQAE